MVALGISEFTFGFSFLYEQTRSNWAKLKAVPVLPSLQDEYDKGWDARLPLVGRDYYFQFKLSDYLSRKNAKYIANGIYKQPYYRISLHNDDSNRQHWLLRKHAKSNPYTYYVAPEMNDQKDFNDAFRARQIVANSRLVQLGKCFDIHDEDQHYITYQTGTKLFIQHSDEKQTGMSYLGRDIAKLYGESRTNWERIDGRFANRLWHNVLDSVQGLAPTGELFPGRAGATLHDMPPEGGDVGAALLRIAGVLSTIYGLTMVIVGTRG